MALCNWFLCVFDDWTNTKLQDEGTVKVNNTCEAAGRPVNILGSASPADPAYGASGVFRVQFPGQPAPSCAGPNYIVQGVYTRSHDDGVPVLLTDI